VTEEVAGHSGIPWDSVSRRGLVRASRGKGFEG
jgi:hypothetical protein